MTKEEFSNELTKLLSKNEIQVNDAMHVLVSHAVMLAVTTRPPTEARRKLHDFVDQIVDDGIRAIARALGQNG